MLGFEVNTFTEDSIQTVELTNWQITELQAQREVGAGSALVAAHCWAANTGVDLNSGPVQQVTPSLVLDPAMQIASLELHRILTNGYVLGPCVASALAALLMFNHYGASVCMTGDRTFVTMMAAVFATSVSCSHPLLVLITAFSGP